ncbi:hypothetical protein N2W54_007480 [Lotmaria passim]
MDHSHELWSLVETSRQQGHLGPLSVKSNAPLPKFSSSVVEQKTNVSLLSTSQTLSDAVANALSRAAAHVHAVVVALDAATPSSTAHLQNNLLLSDAELLSVSSSLKAFTEMLAKADAVVVAKKHKSKADGLSAGQVDGDGSARSVLLLDSEMGRTGSGTGLAAHLQQAVSVQEQRVARSRLQVALAKEELALYKSELFLYGHCGVLACSDAAMAQLSQYRPQSLSPTSAEDAASFASSTSPRLNTRNEASPLPSQLSEDPPLRGAARLSTSSATASPKSFQSGFGTTFRVVDGMMQRAAQTVKAAGSHADTALQVALTGSHAAARQLLNAGTSSVGGILMMGSAASTSTANGDHWRAASFTSAAGTVPLPPITQDDLTEEEEVRLQEQGQALLELQHEATAQDAKAVEASIRELSQLTSLMNEQMAQQTEKFAIVVRNTEAAHTNVRKAVDEVKKPVQAFWNPTRQLIAFLWACMIVVLVANWISR